jgi:hypothetical protein
MLSNRGRHVDQRIRVMNTVHTPERRNLMHGDVRHVEREVEQQHGHAVQNDGVELQRAQDPRSTSLPPQHQPDQPGVEDCIGGKGDEGEGQVGPPTRALPKLARLQRDPALDECQQRHRDQDGARGEKIRAAHATRTRERAKRVRARASISRCPGCGLGLPSEYAPSCKPAL